MGLSAIGKSWNLSAVWVWILLAVLLGLGLFFRVSNLDQKVYWQDETVTSLRVSGYTRMELIQNTFRGQTVSVEDLQTYQRFKPNSTLADAIHSLADEDSQHPPLYYILTRWAMAGFGSSIVVTRGVAAVLSLLAIPCIYWLCLELFQSPLVGGVAAVLLSVAPVHIIYAQEAREYSLWTVTILLCSVALLRAMRRKTLLDWGVYAVTLALSFYTFLFSALVALAHGIYVIVTERRLSKTVIGYGAALLAAGLVFSPWMVIVASSVAQIQETNEWSASNQGLSFLLQRWAANLIHVFFAWNLQEQMPIVHLLLLGCVVLFSLALMTYAFYILCRYAPTKTWLFIVLLAGVTSLILVIPDLITGSYRSGITRYQIPLYLCIELAVAFLFANRLHHSVKHRQRQGWTLVTLLVVSLSVLSSAWINQASNWWTKGGTSYDSLKIAEVANAIERPLLLIGYHFSSTDALSLSYLLKPSVQIQKISEGQPFPRIDNFKDALLLENIATKSEIEGAAEAAQIRLQPVFEGEQKIVWKLTP